MANPEPRLGLPTGAISGGRPDEHWWAPRRRGTVPPCTPRLTE